MQIHFTLNFTVVLEARFVTIDFSKTQMDQRFLSPSESLWREGMSRAQQFCFHLAFSEVLLTQFLSLLDMPITPHHHHHHPGPFLLIFFSQSTCCPGMCLRKFKYWVRVLVAKSHKVAVDSGTEGRTP